MTTTRKAIPIGEATREQLMAFAASDLGIELPRTTNLVTALSRVKQAWSHDQILVNEGAEAKPASSAQRSESAQSSKVPERPKPAKPAEVLRKGFKPRYLTEDEAAVESVQPGFVRIKVHMTEAAGGSEAVPLGVNGAMMWVEREKIAEIRYPYFEVLTRAIEHRYEMDGDRINPVAREVPKYPYSVLGYGEKVAEPEPESEAAAA